MIQSRYVWEIDGQREGKLVSASAQGRESTEGVSSPREKKRMFSESSEMLSCPNYKEGLNRRRQLSQAYCGARGPRGKY